MWYLYILYSASSDKFYIGISQDPFNRLVYHNTQKQVTYTTKNRPWKLTALFKVGSSQQMALNLERFIKKQKSRRLIELLVNPDFVPKNRLAQLVRVPHLRD